MLTIRVETSEAFDEATNMFVEGQTFDLELEHSLVSLSKWESRFKKPFLSSDDKSPEETLWYIGAMTLTPNIPPEVFLKLSRANMAEINAYVSDKMTATWFTSVDGTPDHSVVTSEIIYYWMFALNIPKECETWHLNRLLTLVKVINEKNKPPKKKTRDVSRQSAMNAQRRAQMGSSG